MEIINSSTLPFPLIIMGKGDKIEDIAEDYCYVLTQNGLFMRKSNFLYKSLTPLTKVNGLADIDKQVVRMNLRMPISFFKSIQNFFKAIYDRDKTEVCILLFYSFDYCKWAYAIPEQTVSAGGVKYDMGKSVVFILESNLANGVGELPGADNYKMVGSIHSHASMGAFHSGVDDGDEFGFDGLHITIGNFDRTPTYSARWMLSGQEYKTEMDKVLIDPTENMEFNKEGMKLVKKHIQPKDTKNKSSTDITKDGEDTKISRGKDGYWEKGKFILYRNYEEERYKAEETGFVLHSGG